MIAAAAASEARYSWGVLARCLLLALVASPSVAAAEGPRLYTDASLWGGHRWSERRFADGFTGSDDGPLVMVRYSAGAVIPLDEAWDLRIGPALDLVWDHDTGAAIGLEAEIDRSIDSTWELGGRLSFSVGDGGVASDGQNAMAGLRLRSDTVMFGIDAVFVRQGDSLDIRATNGLMLGAGLSGRPGRYAFAGSAVVATIVGIFALSAMAQGPNH